MNIFKIDIKSIVADTAVSSGRDIRSISATRGGHHWSPAYSMSDQWRLQKGGKLMGWYGRVRHGETRCGIDLSRDSTSIPPVKSSVSPQNPIGKSTFSALPGAERRHHKAPLCGALKISAPLRGERRTSGARTGKVSAF